MRDKETLNAIRDRRGEYIDRAEYTCGYSWCSGTISRYNHHGSQDTFITGRRGDVVDATAVGVHVAYDETEDSRPRILLHIGSFIADIDTDCSPTAAQARRIAIHLLEAADALDDWREQPRPT